MFGLVQEGGRTLLVTAAPLLVIPRITTLVLTP